jgi:hypothetical protein
MESIGLWFDDAEMYQGLRQDDENFVRALAAGVILPKSAEKGALSNRTGRLFNQSH